MEVRQLFGSFFFAKYHHKHWKFVEIIISFYKLGQTKVWLKAKFIWLIREGRRE
jgi:hypothetical protein